MRATNLANGQAFSFNANGGNQVGSITSSNKNAAPFTTNATGVATGLNADQRRRPERVADPDRGVHRRRPSANKFAVINGATGGLAEGRGVTSVAHTSTGVYTVTASETISACAFAATAQSATPATATVVPVRRDAHAGADVRGRRDDRRAGRRRRERAPDHHLLRQVNGTAGARRMRARTHAPVRARTSPSPLQRWPSGPVTIHAAATVIGERRVRMHPL